VRHFRLNPVFSLSRKPAGGFSMQALIVGVAMVFCRHSATELRERLEVLA